MLCLLEIPEEKHARSRRSLLFRSEAKQKKVERNLRLHRRGTEAQSLYILITIQTDQSTAPSPSSLSLSPASLTCS